MSKNRALDKVDDYFRNSQWAAARKVLEKAREADPNNHWVLTQLGVTFYEQKHYQEALQLFLASQKIVPDCPLTLWNLAGTLDALGNPKEALDLYTWLLQSEKSAEDDPCWESNAWTDALKTDCVYRIGICFQHLDQKQNAEDCYHQYVNLLSIGMEGLYSLEDVRKRMQELHGPALPGEAAPGFRKAVDATLVISGLTQAKGQQAPPEIPLRLRTMGRRAASKS